MGRLDDKLIKKRLAVEKTPGPEFFATKAVSGDHGLVLEELSPFGVIASITPSTNPVASVISPRGRASRRGPRRKSTSCNATISAPRPPITSRLRWGACGPVMPRHLCRL